MNFVFFSGIALKAQMAGQGKGSTGGTEKFHEKLLSLTLP
jgi:hypothetical protein